MLMLGILCSQTTVWIGRKVDWCKPCFENVQNMYLNAFFLHDLW